MGRRAAVPAIVLASVLTCLAGCSDIPGPVGTTQNSLGLIVSAPVSPPVGAARLAGPTASAVSASTVYVSLPPGSVPAGVRATITNQATGLSITTGVIDGGFDPVPIAASVGDTLVTEIAGAASTVLDQVPLAVSSVRPLKVVRTSPPSGGRDVPLNAAIVIVFSEPMDPATLTTGTLQLWRDATPVAGTVRFADALQLRVEFHPDSLLAAQTAHRLVVTQGIRDVNGMALDSPLDVPFTTGMIGPATGFVFASVSAGFNHSCGVTTAGKAYCWGYNAFGELGDGTYGNMPSMTPVPVAGGLTFASVSAGYISTCGVTTVGTAYCWGNSGYGKLGIDSVTMANSCSLYVGAREICPTPLPVAGGHTFKMVSAAGFHACGVTTDGAAYCWGDGTSGQLGDGCTSCVGTSSTPVAVAGGHTFATVSVEDGITCGVATDGAAYCWGGSSGGELGAGASPQSPPCRTLDGSTFCSSIPVAVTGGLTFTGISAGKGFTCGVASTGAAYCWGLNNWGQLGTGSTTGPQVCVTASGSLPCSTSPVPVDGGLAFSMMSVKDLNCGLTTAGAAYCWGAFQEYPNTIYRTSPVPVPVPGGLTFAAVSVGEIHMCGVTTSGVAYCWGNNSFGLLGDGTTTDSSVPVKVAGQP